MKTLKKSLIILLIPFLGNLYAQSPLDKRIDELVGAMTTEEKMEQMYNVRTSFGGTAANTRLGIPGFVMGDGPHGVRFTQDLFGRSSTAFPTGIAMTATWDEALLGEVGEAMGVEFWSFGRHQALGPCLDLARDSRGGRTAESGGEDPYLAGHLAKALVNGIQKYPVIATLKHFMGEGKQANRLQINVTASQRWLMDFSGYNFRVPVQEAGAMSVMGSYNKIGGDKCSENTTLLKTILRERWGFPFYVVSDWASIDDARKAVRAGTEICMGSSMYEADLPGLVQNGFVTIEDLDRSVKNILKTKILNGMLDYFPEGDEANAQTQEIRDLNLLTAQKSIVLLKNENKSDARPILPLKKTGVKIALIGPNATAENLNCFGSSATNPPYAVSVKEGLETKIGAANVLYAKGCDINSTSTSGFAAAKTIAAEADFVIFAGGLDDTQEGEGFGRGTDRVGDSFALPAIQQTLMNELAAVNPNLIAVIQSGGVCTFNNCLDNIKGLVYSFYAAQEAGHAIANVVFGDYNPAGRMPLSMPMQDSDFPSWAESSFAKYEQNRDGGYRWLDENGTTPRYAFGFGMSYTTFSYANLVMPTEIVAGQPFTLSVDVTNTGSIAGEEVIQVYISAPSTDKLWMPKKELRGFKRVAFEAGETKTITFDFCADDFYYWNTSGRKYEVLTGDYTIRVGGSSCNLPLSQPITFKSGTAKPDLRITRVYTMPRFPLEGEKVSFYALVKNQGNAATTAKTTYDISFNVAGQKVAGTTKANTIIAPGQVQLIASDSEWTAANAGEMQLTAQIAFSAADTEWDIDNNSYEADFEVFSQSVVSSKLKNLAYLKNVTVSSESGKYYGRQIVDGDLSTYWSSQASATENALIDLEALCAVEQIKLFWDGAYAKQYILEKSENGADWTEVKKVTAGTGSVESYDFATFEARYIRIRCTERKSGASSYALRELQIFGYEKQKMPGARVIIPESTVLLPHAKTYVDGTGSTNSTEGELTYRWEQIAGPAQATIISPELPLTELIFNTAGTYTLSLTVSNGVDTAFKEFSIVVSTPTVTHDLALKKPASASNSEKVTLYPQAAVDGNDNTRWSSLHKNGEWWQVDLQHQVKPSKISILWHREYAKKFNIQLSADGDTWNTYATNDAFTGGTSVSTNASDCAGRYVRVNIVERNGQWESSFFTFSLYGDFVTNTNQVPQAKAKYRKQDNSIVLDATESVDADGDNLSYKWEQITGPAFVKITDAETDAAKISVPRKGSYYFKLIVDDGKDIDFTILHVVADAGSQIQNTSSASSPIRVYPNPVKDYLFIESESNEKFDYSDVYDISGKLVTTKMISSNVISLNELNAGVYYLCLYSDRKKTTKNIKIIKE